MLELLEFSVKMFSDESFITAFFRPVKKILKSPTIFHKKHLCAGPRPDNLCSIPASGCLTLLQSSPLFYFIYFNWEIIVSETFVWQCVCSMSLNRIIILVEVSLRHSKQIITRTSCWAVCVVFHRWKLKQCSYQLWLCAIAINVAFQILGWGCVCKIFKCFPIDFFNVFSRLHRT